MGVQVRVSAGCVLLSWGRIHSQERNSGVRISFEMHQRATRGDIVHVR